MTFEVDVSLGHHWWTPFVKAEKEDLGLWWEKKRIKKVVRVDGVKHSFQYMKFISKYKFVREIFAWSCP